MEMNKQITRRTFHQAAAMTTAATGLGVKEVYGTKLLERDQPYRLNYIVSSAMYGEFALKDILPEVRKTGAHVIDIWCRVHGNQREQIDDMGVEAFQQLLKKHQVELGVSTDTHWDHSGWRNEMVKGLRKIVLCTRGPREPEGAEAKSAVKAFLEQMKPHVARAEELGITIALENHDRQLLYHPDALRYFAEFNRSKYLGIALAFHHLHKWEEQIPQLCRDLCPEHVPFIYFQEHSEGIRTKASKEIEMQQMPGFGGGLDYRPIVKAEDVDYQGFVETLCTRSLEEYRSCRL